MILISIQTALLRAQCQGITSSLCSRLPAAVEWVRGVRTDVPMSPEPASPKELKRMQENDKPLVLTKTPAPGFKPATSDYSLVLKQAYELSAENVKPVPKGEIGVEEFAPDPDFKKNMHHQVLIKQPARSAAQQAGGQPSAPNWTIIGETKEKWINPLIGWTSTADGLENVASAALWFYTQEQAIAFCDKMGWTWDVEEPHEPRKTRQKRFAG